MGKIFTIIKNQYNSEIDLKQILLGGELAQSYVLRTDKSQNVRTYRITASVVIGEETTICPTWADAVELVNTLPKDGEVGQATIYLLKDLSRYENLLSG